MGRTNLDPIMTFQDGSHLLISTASIPGGSFVCTLYQATMTVDDRGAFRLISSPQEAATCMMAQRDAYHHAQQLYPRLAEAMKEPPYLIWSGPGATGNTHG